MFEQRKKLRIKELREEQKLVHELSKLSILIMGTVLLAAYALTLMYS